MTAPPEGKPVNPFSVQTLTEIRAELAIDATADAVREHSAPALLTADRRVADLLGIIGALRWCDPMSREMRDLAADLRQTLTDLAIDLDHVRRCLAAAVLDGESPPPDVLTIAARAFPLKDD